jgi:hypothetical protein
MAMAAAALSLLAAGSARGASIELGAAAGARGQRVSVAATLRTMGASVLGTQNRISFDRQTPIVANEQGTPDCAVNPAIDKSATGFRYLPLGCDPAADCESVRVFVLAFDNLDPIPDGAELYTCAVGIAEDAAAGPHLLVNTETNASAANGGVIETSGTDGMVTVSTGPVASIDIGTVAGTAGTTVSVPVMLHLLDAGAQGAAVRHDLAFDPLTPIAAAPSGDPACAVAAELHHEGTFTFLPAGCTPGTDCSGIRAMVAPAGEADAIPDGARLYSCDVAIDASALGTYALVADMPSALGLDARPLPVIASDGAVDVSAAPPPPPPICVGDCNGDGGVVINELLIGVNIAADRAPLSTCALLDVDDDGAVKVNELIRAVNNALNGCPSG